MLPLIHGGHQRAIDGIRAVVERKYDQRLKSASAALADKVAGALEARLAKTVVGNPRSEAVTMGPVVSKSQQKAVLDAIKQLTAEAKTVLGGECAGHVVAVGAAVADLRVGDPVIAFAIGGLADHVTRAPKGHGITDPRGAIVERSAIEASE